MSLHNERCRIGPRFFKNLTYTGMTYTLNASVLIVHSLSELPDIFSNQRMTEKTLGLP